MEMKNKKLIISLIVISVLMFTLAGCSGQEKIKISGIEDLADKTIGVQLGTTGDELASEIEQAKVERYNRYVDAITSLKQKKVDALIMDMDTASTYVEVNEDLVILDVGFDPEQYAIAVEIGDSELLAVVNQVIAEMKEDGSLAASLESHQGMQGEAPDFNVGAAGGKLVVGTEDGFPPYEYLSNGVVIGTDMDIMARVAKELDKELVIENMNFDGLIPALQSGKIDAIAAGMSILEERKVNVDFSDHYVDASQVVVIRKASLAD